MWTTYRGHPARTGALTGVEPARDPGSETAWTVRLGGGTVLQDTIRVAAGRVYVGRSDGLSVLDAATGQQRWRYTDHAPECGLTVLSESNPAVPDGICDGADALVFLAHTGGVVRLADDGDRGRVERTIDGVVDPSVSSALCHPPGSRYMYVVFGTGGTNIRSVEVVPIRDQARETPPDTLQISESVYTPLSAGSVGSSASDDETRVYVPTGDEWFPKDVSIVESASVVGRLTDFDDLSPPVVPDGQVLFCQHRDAISTKLFEGRDLARCDLSRGLDTPDWSSGYCVADHAPVVTPSQLIATCRHGETLTAVGHDGSEHWTVELSQRQTDTPGPIAVGEVAYVVDSGSLVAIDRRGEELFDYDTETPIRALAGADPGLYVATEDAVYALTDVDGTRVFTPSQNDCPDCRSDLSSYDDPGFCPECGHSL